MTGATDEARLRPREGAAMKTLRPSVIVLALLSVAACGRSTERDSGATATRDDSTTSGTTGGTRASASAGGTSTGMAETSVGGSATGTGGRAGTAAEDAGRVGASDGSSCRADSDCASSCFAPDQQCCATLCCIPRERCDDQADGDAYCASRSPSFVCQPLPAWGPCVTKGFDSVIVPQCAPRCTSDAMCQAGWSCGADGHCAPTRCGGATTCPADFSCSSAGVCERKSCNADNECSSACVKGRCFDRAGTCRSTRCG